MKNTVSKAAFRTCSARRGIVPCDLLNSASVLIVERFRRTHRPAALRILSKLASPLVLAAVCAPVSAQGLPAPVFYNSVPFSLRTQNVVDLASQRNFGGPRDAGLIGSVCSACNQSGSQRGRNELAAQGFAQLGADLPGLNLLYGGNQFFGQAQAPQTFYSSFSDPFAAGGGFSSAFRGISSVFGFGTGSNSPVNFGASILQGYDPVFSGGFGFGFGGNIFNQHSALAVMRDTALAVQTRASSPISQVESRYLALAGQQVDVFYSDDTLSALRAELNASQLLFLYSDPLHSHTTYELNVLLQQLLSTRPSYQSATALAQRLASYTSPHDDNAILEQRYSERLALVASISQVDFEARSYLAADPVFANQLASLSTSQFQRAQQISASAPVVTHGNDWSNRFQSAFADSAGFQNLSQWLESIFNDFPGFREYLQLNQEVVNLLSTFGNHPTVAEASRLMVEINADPAVAQSIAGFYHQFTEEVDELLRGTAYKAEVERAYERLNGLVESAPTYRLLKDTQFLSVLALDELQRQIHGAVANCFAIARQFCDPYSDPAVLALLPGFNADTFNLLASVGQFYEFYNTFLYRFSRSDAYLALQADSVARVQASLDPALPGLTAAQERFTKSVNDIPQVSAVHNAIASSGAALRSESVELDARLSRMTILVGELTADPTRAPAPAPVAAPSAGTGPVVADSGGGGCTIGAGPKPHDPVLVLLAMLAGLMAWRPRTTGSGKNDFSGRPPQQPAPIRQPLTGGLVARPR